MKKGLLIGMLAVVCLMFNSCISYTNRTSPDSSKVNWEVINMTVYKNDWKYTNFANKYDNNYYYCTKNLSQLTSFVAKSGNVQVYVVLDKGGKNERQQVLPYVRHYEEHNGGKFYTETVDCSFGTGWVEFALRQSDFAYEDDYTNVPETMHFRVVLTY